MGRRDKSSIFGAVRIKKKVLADNLKRAREAYRQKRAQMQQEQVNLANENIASDLTKLESSPHQYSAEVCLTPAPSTSTSSTVAADRGSQNKPETVQDQATVNTAASKHDVQMTMKVVQANEQRFLEIEPPNSTRDRATREEGTMRLAYIQQEEKIPQVCPKCYSELPDCFLAKQTQHKQVRSIIARVYHFLEREYEQLKSLHPETDWSPLSRVRQRAAVATGVSEPDVRDILSEESDIAADEDPPRKRPRTEHQSEYDDVNEAEQIEEALHEPDVYVATKPALEPNPLEDSEDETIIIKEEQDDNITYYTVMEAVSAPEETEDQSSVCIPKPEPPDVPHSLDINYSVNSSAVEACRDDIVRRDKQTTISQPAPHVHTHGQYEHTDSRALHSNVSQLSDSMLLQVKQEDITIEEEGVS